MTKQKLAQRVENCREQLKTMEIKNPKHFFCLKYPEYKPKDDSDKESFNKIDNLYYGKITDEDFTVKLESFVTFNKTHYK